MIEALATKWEKEYINMADIYRRYGFEMHEAVRAELDRRGTLRTHPRVLREQAIRLESDELNTEYIITSAPRSFPSQEEAAAAAARWAEDESVCNIAVIARPLIVKEHDGTFRAAVEHWVGPAAKRLAREAMNADS